MTAKLAVLVPTYNGGDLLRHTIRSCAAAGLSPERYTILVVDNASADGSVNELPSRDAAGAEIRLVRNSENIGRVANWNRALELADPTEFTFATFLFVGDGWLPGGGCLSALLAQMEAADALIGMAPFLIEDAEGRPVRRARQMTVTNPLTVIPVAEVLRRSIRCGAMVFGPLQATVYRLQANGALRFDPASPSHTDQEATVQYLHRHGGAAVISADPFMAWRAHGGRFHLSMNVVQQLRDDISMLERVSGLTGCPVHWGEAHSRLLLRYAFAARRNPRLTLDILRTLHRRPGGVNPIRVASAAVAAAASRGSVIRFT